MADGASTAKELSDRIPFIYEPIQAPLDRVVENLKTLAAEARLGGDASLVQHAVVSGGKKVRPAVTLLAGAMRPGHDEELITMATAIELLHIATLIHDDTVDKAATRRGRATVSSMWGDDVAVLLGDYVFAASATFVCDTGNLRVVRRFSETIMELARGELAEHFSTHDWNQSIDDYNDRIYNKTASLFCTAAQSGGVLSGAPEDEAQALSRYGYNLGMAFQIMDDVLDFMGTEEELGKPVGNDLLQGTLTLPALLYASRYPKDVLLARLRDGGRDPEDLKRLVELISASPVIDETFTVMNGYRDEALASLALLPSHRSRESLEALTDYVGQRRS
jgi:heptaprenyl diphosphate synthase/octaprenyl-diphosphate synthase